MTGVSFFIADLAAKRLELLREVVPAAARVAVLVNPSNPSPTASIAKSTQAAAPSLGLKFQVVLMPAAARTSTPPLQRGQDEPDALIVSPILSLIAAIEQLVALGGAPRDCPSIIALRDFAEAGGLMSYGHNVADAYRQAGVYAGRILKGAKPARSAGRSSRPSSSW